MIVARKIDPVEQPKKYIAELKKFKVAKNNNARLNDIAEIYKTGLFNRQGTGQKYGLIDKFSKSGIVPKNIIFPGDLEYSIVDVYNNTNKNPTGKDIQAVLNASGS